jgi:O-antigen/teichoic acid export membrane protein
LNKGFAVPAGSLVQGLTAYGFLVVAARALPPEAYAPLAALWALVFATAPALFIPFEQDIARRLARRDEGAPGGVAVVRAGAFCALVALTVAVALALPWVPVLHGRALDGSGLLLAALALSVVGYGLTHLVRGVLLGTGHLQLYGGTLAGEGVLRLLAAVVLLLLAVESAGPYGLAVGAAPLVIGLLCLPAVRRAARSRPPGASAGELSPRTMLRTLLWLVVATVLSFALINGGPLVVKLLAGPDETQDAGRLLAGLLLVRLPFFAFPTLQAFLLPRFAALTAVRDRGAAQALARRVAAVHLGLTVPAVAATALVGPPVVRFVFGGQYGLGSLDLALLTLGAAGHLLAMLLGLALIAQGRSAALALAWGGAAGIAGLTIALVEPLLLRVELGLLAGSWTAVAVVIGAIAAERGSRSGVAVAVVPPSTGTVP